MREIRNNETLNSTDSESRLVEGYAVVFNSRSVDLGGFYEVIERNALDGVIEKSDVVCLLNHDINRGVLARSRNGQGSLSLSIDEKGLKFSFEAPKTSLGDEILEGVRRGDVSKCSFAFTVADDEYSKQEDGTILRTIRAIDSLYDVSVVYNPAYEATEVDTRGLDLFLSNEQVEVIEERSEEKEKEVEECEEKEEQTETEKETEDTETKEEVQQAEEENREDSEKEEELKEDVPEDETEKEEKSEEVSDQEEEKRNNNNNTKHINMKKNFSLLKTINDIANNRSIDEVAQGVIAEGRSAATKAGITTNGQIQLALETEKRFEATPNGILASQNEEAVTYGGESVPTETLDILGALRDRLVISNLGAKLLTLSGNVEIPVYDGANCTWESEIGSAKDGSGKFKTVKLSPKRLTAVLPISKQYLIQTSDSAEALLRQDLIDCIAEKLQQTIFGSEQGTDTKPEGLFYNVTEDGAAFTYKDAVEMEKELEEANVYGEYGYVLSPSAKAVLRTTPIDKGSGRMVLDNNQVLGINALSTNSVVSKGVILGNWSNFYLASFGALDLIVDPYTAASKGQVLLTVNAYFDYATVRPEAFVKRVVKA